jgi:hypothetical protein
MDDELVERDDKGQYVVTAPSSTYKQMMQMREGDEETGTDGASRNECSCSLEERDMMNVETLE